MKDQTLTGTAIMQVRCQSLKKEAREESHSACPAMNAAYQQSLTTAYANNPIDTRK